MFGYRAVAAVSASSHARMDGSAHGPSVRSVLTSTHSTGSLPITAIIRSIRRSAGSGAPAAMLAASVVPRASTQQPWKPAARRRVATSSAFSWPASRSTVERAPEISEWKSVTPTAA